MVWKVLEDSLHVQYIESQTPCFLNIPVIFPIGVIEKNNFWFITQKVRVTGFASAVLCLFKVSIGHQGFTLEAELLSETGRTPQRTGFFSDLTALQGRQKFVDGG